MIKIAIANMKGGVAKSTTALMLADTLSLHQQKRVLLVDCDPQANLSQMVLSFPGLISARDQASTLTDWLDGVTGRVIDNNPPAPGRLASETIQANVSGLADFKPGFFKRAPSKGKLSIWPSTPALRFAELWFDHLNFESGDISSPRKSMSRYLAEGLAEGAANDDIVIFDCPPGFSTLAQAALCQADLIISPLNIDHISSWSLKTFWNQALDDVLGDDVSAKRCALLTMVRGGNGGKEERLNLRRDIRKFAGDKLLNTEIPYSVQALRYATRSSIDSVRRFRFKYNSLHQKIEKLGVEILEHLPNLQKETSQ